MTTVIIPAHNEERVIGRLLTSLLEDADPGEFDVVVVCNGCTDGTAAVASRFPSVRVVEIEDASKHLALCAGDAAAKGFPRLYIDADVILSTDSARALVAALATSDVLAVAPQRSLRLTDSGLIVRMYHRIWSELPAVKGGLFGRGVIGVGESGYQRIARRPALLGDDLYVHSQFDATERAVVADSTVIVYGPGTVADLLRRRTRAAQGNRELDAQAQTSSTRSSSRGLLRLARQHPYLWPHIVVFIGVTAISRYRARRLKGHAVWLRDESSRT